MVASAFADRVIDVPTGHTLPQYTFEYSFLESTNEKGSRDRYMVYSPLKGVEVGLRQRFRPNENGHTTADFSYNVVNPISSVSPGISVGMLDAMDQTVDGRRTYIAFTFRELLQVGERGEHGEATLGVQFGHLNSGFVGVTLPLGERFQLLTEHNGNRISAGFEIEPSADIRARVVTQDGTLLFGLNLSRRF
ncbi:MAG: hypothetical protein JST12_11165 [Armatimonadetes bacterium]|nr:hypothetical protein [Armatimonadota bacterium]